jgi:hypothetical protein
MKGGYHIQDDGTIGPDNFTTGNDPRTGESITENQSDRITWNGKDYYNIDDALIYWFHKSDKDPQTGQSVLHVKKHFSQDMNNDLRKVRLRYEIQKKKSELLSQAVTEMEDRIIIQPKRKYVKEANKPDVI